jgi:hypothetical protein
MSRRHHGGRPHRPGGHARSPIAPTAAAPTEAPRPPAPEAPVTDGPIRVERPPVVEAAAPSAVAAPPVAPVAGANGSPLPTPSSSVPMAYPPRRGGEALAGSAGCTAPQLRRFIKSRPYVPMHELRRRFGINGQEDDVTPVDLAAGRIFVGLPAREGGLLGELLRGGEVGYELSLDPRSPIVVGLYPMRPVPRT